VLTAAHCEGYFRRIEVNRYDFTNTTEAVETFGFLNTIPHPRHNDSTYQFDAMLVKLDGIVRIIDPIRINDLSEVPTATTSLTVVGWGVTDKVTESSADIFQEADVTYVPNIVCARIRDQGGYSLGSELTGDMMCAGDEGIDSCYGDSGSPLIIRGVTPEEDIQVGVVSWGLECAGPIPGIYSRLSTMYVWIRRTICNKSSDPPDHWQCDSPAPSQLPSTAPSDQPSNVASGSPTVVDLTDNDPNSSAQNPPFAGLSTTKGTYLTFTLLLISTALV
jgi:secreted trypsin-like serine protease